MALSTVLHRLQSIVRGVISGVDGAPLDEKNANDTVPKPSRRDWAFGNSAAFQAGSQASPTPTPVPAPDLRSELRQKESANAKLRGLTWIGSDSTVRLSGSGLELQGPLTYFLDQSSQADVTEPSAVNLRLPFAPQAQPPAARELSYWPRYDQLTSNQRKIYLDWLASGRKLPPVELGYTFLFIYGLERRALVEHQDVKLIFKEVFRLRQAYEASGQQGNRSFERYTVSFMWLMLHRDKTVFSSRYFEALAKSIRVWDDESLAMALSWLASNNAALPPWLAFAVAGQLPKSQRSVVVKRVGNELQDLFCKKYKEHFGDGIALKCSKRDRKFAYRPASNVLPTFEMSGPNPLGILSQFNVLSTLWNDCIVSLKKLSSAVGTGTNEGLTIKAWNALPIELRSGVDHPLTDQFAHFIEEHTGDSPQTIVDARSLATLAGIAPDAKLTIAASRRMTETVENVGYLIEPDARLSGRAYEANQPVVLFLNLGEGTIDAAKYTAASTMLSVGLALAQLNGDVDENEVTLISQQIDSTFELNESEQRRLGMLRAVHAARGADLSHVTKPLKTLHIIERERICKFALALVAADGVVTKEELKAVRRLYSAMGMHRDEADTALAEITKSSATDEPVTVLPAVAGSEGETIPSEIKPDKTPGISLNRAAIAAILKDTQDVSRMLAEAMSADQQDGQDHPEPIRAETTLAVASVQITTPAVEVATDVSVPARYAAFYQMVVVREKWERNELLVLAKQHGLMLAGAVEAINDWSTEKHGGPIIYEDEQQYTLESAYLN